MRLYKALRNIVPDTYSTFKYLTRNNDYHFSEWSGTTENQIYLYYWFYAKDKIGKNTKRVVIQELESLLSHCIQNNITLVNRKLFKSICPTTYSSGPCGYCVSIRLFEFLGIAKYQGSNGFELIDKEKIKQILT